MRFIKSLFKYLFKYNKQEKKDYKAYCKMMKTNKKKLIKFAKEFGPWDANIEFITGIRLIAGWTQDYFTQDWNVWQDKEANENEFDKLTSSLSEIIRNADLILKDEFFDPYFALRNELLGKPEMVKTIREESPCKGAMAITIKTPKEETPEIKKQLETKGQECVKAKERAELDLFMTLAKNYERYCD